MEIRLKDNSLYTIGDPYILRFDGKYYLYPSTIYEECGVRAFSSTDLIHFKDEGFVVEEDILRCAYAPEVIYHNGSFYLITSPKGEGHYLYIGSSPLGPFKRISENLHNMIDGSFFINKDFDLCLLRADHGGIVQAKLQDNHFVERKNILEQVSHGWTEGPSLFYHDGYNYITYCGNFLTAKNYRIKIASSLDDDKNFLIQDDILIMSTKDDFHALGHNSVIISPDMKDKLIVYHNLFNNPDGSHFRYMNIDKLDFSKRRVSCNVTNTIKSYLRPDIEFYKEDLNYFPLEKFYLSKEEYSSFIFEINLLNENTIILFFKDYLNYTYLEAKDHNVKIYKKINGIDTLLFSKTLKISFKDFHTFRFKTLDKLEICLDNVYLTSINLSSGRLGYLNNDVSYLALSLLNKQNNYTYLPGIIESYLFENNYIKKADYLDEGYISLIEKQTISLNVKSLKKINTKLFLNIKSDSHGEIEISTSSKKKKFKIDLNNDEYEFYPIYIDEFNFLEDDVIKITLLSGNLSFKNILVKEILDEFTFTNEKYHFVKPTHKEEITFSIQEYQEDSLFGLILNASDFVIHPANKDPSYLGYLIGFRNSLLVVEEVQYDTKRIYDKPINLQLKQEYTLRIEYDNSLLKVYLNNQKLFQTTLQSYLSYGYGGYFKNSHSNVILKNFKEEI